jgi:hypothetical protein
MIKNYAIDYYGLSEDKKRDTVRWRAMEPMVAQMVKFLEMVVANELKEKIFTGTDYNDPKIIHLLGLKG